MKFIGLAGLILLLTALCPAQPQYEITISRQQIKFGAIPIGQTSKVHPLKITNSGTAAVSLVASASPSQFQETTACGTLAPSESCFIYLSFTPTAKGKIAGSLSISVSANGVQLGIIQMVGTAE